MTKTHSQRGILFVLVGPGGAGKNTIMHEAIKRIDNLQQLPTATTRPKRDSELEGREHFFVTREEFQDLIDRDALLEHQEVTTDKFYGIVRDVVENYIIDGQDLIADIEVHGATILRETYPQDTVLVFIDVPGRTVEEKLDVLSGRLSTNDRKESPQLIQDRLERARVLELPFAEACDYVIVNAELEQATLELIAIIQQKRAERLHPVTEEGSDAS